MAMQVQLGMIRWRTSDATAQTNANGYTAATIQWTVVNRGLNARPFRLSSALSPILGIRHQNPPGHRQAGNEKAKKRDEFARKKGLTSRPHEKGRNPFLKRQARPLPQVSVSARSEPRHPIQAKAKRRLLQLGKDYFERTLNQIR